MNPWPVWLVMLLFGVSLHAGAQEAEENFENGVVDVEALKIFWQLQPPVFAQNPGLSIWIANLDPLDELCATIVEQPWIIGTSSVVTPISDGSGFFINLPLAAYGAISYLADGTPVSDGSRTDTRYDMDDNREYLEALGLYLNTHEGIGTTSFLQVLARPIEAPVLCNPQ